MEKKLAIKGHPTRGKEVIELLEMLGGINDREYIGTNTWKDEYYFLDNGYIRAYDWCDGIKFTLEEFLWKYPFKVGDKVVVGYGDNLTIKSMAWSEDYGTMVYDFNNSVIVLCAEDLLKWNKLPTNKETVDMKLGDDECERTREDAIFDSIIWHLRNSVNNGKQNLSGGECEDYFREVVKKNNENKMKNVLADLLEHIKTTPKEDLEREFEEIEEWSNVGPTVEEFMDFCDKVNKKPKYPTTYEECFNIHTNQNTLSSLANKTDALYNLLICRNAYWKIAGEEMGLSKSWEPDWSTEHERKYVIEVYRNNVRTNSQGYSNTILAFPTKEMRDAFYENFKKEVEQCKELL